MAQPQAQQRRPIDYLQDLEHVPPVGVVDSTSPASQTEPAPLPIDLFPASDTY